MRIRNHRDNVCNTVKGQVIELSPMVGGRIHFANKILPTVEVFSSTISIRNTFAPTTGGNIVNLPIVRSNSITATEWLSLNKRLVARHPGKYVAISNKGIIAVAEDSNNIYRKARELGILNPLVFKVPKVSERKRVVSVKSL